MLKILLMSLWLIICGAALCLLRYALNICVLIAFRSKQKLCFKFLRLHSLTLSRLADYCGRVDFAIQCRFG